MQLDQIDIIDSNMEYLVGLDYCAYRMPCKVVMGDRSYKLTNKKYQAKINMLDVYKEALTLKKDNLAQSDSKSSIFDATSNLGPEPQKKAIGLENSIAQLKDAIDKVKSESGSQEGENIIK